MGTRYQSPAFLARAARVPLGLWTVLALIGFTAVVAQIVFMRELIVVFYGNEISLGFILASWLLWTAVGSSSPGRFAARVRQPRRLMAWLQVLIAAAFPATIFAVRTGRGALQALPGEILGPGVMLLTSFATLSLFCVLSGCMFAAGSRLYAGEAGASTARATGVVYLLEAVGSGIGGVVASLVLIRYLGSFEIASLLALLNLLAAAGLVVARPRVRFWLMAAVLVVFVLLVFPIASSRLEEASLARLWHGFHLLAVRNSVYGSLAVTETEGTRTLYENGLVLCNVPDLAVAEETVHFALLQHPSPRSLLLIGGGMNGSVVQALQHSSLERLDYVELDPAILELARTFFPSAWTSVESDRRVHIHNMDGRLFLKTTESTFDVIIVNLPDPQTAQLNRFYTLEFFQEAARKLNASGVLSFRLTAGEAYINPQLAAVLRCINKTLRQVFPGVVSIPGSNVHFFAANQPGILLTDADGILARLRSRHIHTSYVREYYIPFRMMPDRMLDLASEIQPEPATPVNRDFAPIAYYFDVVLWSTRFSSTYRGLFESVARVDFSVLGVVTGVLLITIAWALREFVGHVKRLPVTAASSVAAMGFTLIGLELLLLLAFQAVYGYVYHQLAIVVAGFMAGAALGSWWCLRGSGAGEAVTRKELRNLAGLQLLGALTPLALFAIFESFAGIRSPVVLSLVSNLLFPGLALLCGVLGGYQFPLASRIFFAGRNNGRSPGMLYALDLGGACLGALLLSAYLLPVYGFFRTALLMALLNLGPAILAVFGAAEHAATST